MQLNIKISIVSTTDIDNTCFGTWQTSTDITSIDFWEKELLPMMRALKKHLVRKGVK